VGHEGSTPSPGTGFKPKLGFSYSRVGTGVASKLVIAADSTGCPVRWRSSSSRLGAPATLTQITARQTGSASAFRWAQQEHAGEERRAGNQHRGGKRNLGCRRPERPPLQHLAEQRLRRDERSVGLLRNGWAAAPVALSSSLGASGVPWFHGVVRHPCPLSAGSTTAARQRAHARAHLARRRPAAVRAAPTFAPPSLAGADGTPSRWPFSLAGAVDSGLVERSSRYCELEQG
jgi:hypothetical protein